MREGQRQDREVNSRAAQFDETDGEGKLAREQRLQDQLRNHVHCQQFESPDRGIGADAEKGGMAKGQVAGQAEQDVKPDRENAEDGELLQKVRVTTADRGHDKRAQRH